MNQHVYIKVAEIMTPSVHTIDRTATVKDAILLMRQHGVSSLAVQRRDVHDEFGLLSVTDVAREVIAQDRSADRVNVYEIMSKPVLTVHEDMDIKYAVRLLVKFGVSRAVVVGPDRAPVGIVTLRDMVLRHAPAAED